MNDENKQLDTTQQKDYSKIIAYSIVAGLISLFIGLMSVPIASPELYTIGLKITYFLGYALTVFLFPLFIANAVKKYKINKASDNDQNIALSYKIVWITFLIIAIPQCSSSIKKLDNFTKNENKTIASQLTKKCIEEGKREDPTATGKELTEICKIMANKLLPVIRTCEKYYPGHDKVKKCLQNDFAKRYKDKKSFYNNIIETIRHEKA